MKKFQLERLKLASSRCKKDRFQHLQLRFKTKNKQKTRRRMATTEYSLSALANRLDFNLINDYYMNESHFIFANDPDFIFFSK